GVFPVNLGGGCGEDKFLFLAGGFKDQLRAVDIGLDGLDRALDNELDANGCRQMDDDLGIIHKFSEQLAIFDAVQVVLHLARGFEMADVFDAARRKIIQQNDAVAAIEKALRQVRTNEASTTGNQVTQRASLKGLGVIIAIAGAMSNGIGLIFMRSFKSFLGTISIRIGIIPVGVVVVRRAGIHGVENDAEDVALDAA